MKVHITVHCDWNVSREDEEVARELARDLPIDILLDYLVDALAGDPELSKPVAFVDLKD